VLAGVGDGTFAGAAHFAAGEGPYFLAIGELNGDQSPDLVIASGLVSILFNQSAPLGDVDADGDVDLDDFAFFPACRTGPEGGPYPDGCDALDFDRDLDIDLADLAGFLRAFGPIL
jgi:hypothetical protein